MITVQPFNIEEIRKHDGYYRLNSIHNVSELQIVHNTPAGYVETDIADAFSMNDGSIVIAWKYALKVSPMHNLIAISGQTKENINLIPLERIIDIYDRPVNASVGVFSFTNSVTIVAPHLDWRCDNGRFGPLPFANPEGIFEAPSGIVIYEPILPINGVGYIVYVEGVGKQDLANAYLNMDTRPVSGRTLWETLKLVQEWAIVNQEPFNNNEEVAQKAFQFMQELYLSEAELSAINSQIPMQIANYLSGSTNARQRPNGILPTTSDIKNLLFSRMSSGSISALEYMNPGMYDLQELLDAENTQLAMDVRMFEHLKTIMDPNKPVIPIQERVLKNKQIILSKVSSGEF